MTWTDTERRQYLAEEMAKQRRLAQRTGNKTHWRCAEACRETLVAMNGTEEKLDAQPSDLVEPTINWSTAIC